MALLATLFTHFCRLLVQLDRLLHRHPVNAFEFLALLVDLVLLRIFSEIFTRWIVRFHSFHYVDILSIFKASLFNTFNILRSSEQSKFLKNLISLYCISKLLKLDIVATIA